MSFTARFNLPTFDDEEYVCDGVGCETCTFDPCYYADGDAE